MLKCSEVQSSLVELLYEEIDAEARAHLLAHLNGCGECQERWSHLQALSAAVDRWTTPPHPRGIAERALVRIASERAREREAAEVYQPAMAIQHLLAFLLAGAAAASLSLLLVAAGSLHEESPLKIGVVGALWTALYGGASFLVQQGRYRRLALAALIATGLSVLFAPVLSMPAVIEACRRWLETAQASVALNGVILLAGALYAATPVFLSSAALMRARPGGIASDAVRLVGVYGLLLTPSVYLQCHPLALSLIAPWVAGLLLGSCLGSMGGVAVAARLRPVPA